MLSCSQSKKNHRTVKVYRTEALDPDAGTDLTEPENTGYVYWYIIMGNNNNCYFTRVTSYSVTAPSLNSQSSITWVLSKGTPLPIGEEIEEEPSVVDDGSNLPESVEDATEASEPTDAESGSDGGSDSGDGGGGGDD